MERSVESSDGADKIRKKLRSVYLRSIYKSKVSKEVLSKILKRKRGPECDSGDGGESVKKKGKSRKEAPLRSFGKKSSKSLDEVYSGGGGANSGSNDSDSSSRLIGSVSLSLEDNVVKIPRRRRGLVGRKKNEDTILSKPPTSPALPTSSSKSGSVDGADKLVGDSSTLVISRRVKWKKESDETKENKSTGSNSVGHLRKEHSNSVLSNSSSRKNRKEGMRKKSLGVEKSSIAKEADPIVGNHNKFCDNLHEDDEENLEQNAARMLSSRFDPSCTGFLSKRKEHVSAAGNGLPLLSSSGRDIGPQVRTAGGSESVTLDMAGRVLRPRKQHKQKGLSRKRRHFYEILAKDLDAYWVLQRRIKVFWPLDQSWYFGLINDYDPERKLHHVNYDDRDEEWINLQNERFKLLLLPSEVPGKTQQKKRAARERHADVDRGNTGLSIEDDSYISSYMDSEPIISWLARSNLRVKSPPNGVLKKQKTSSPSSDFVSVFPRKKVDPNKQTDAGSSEGNAIIPFCKSTLAGRSTDAQGSEMSTPESTIGSKDEKQPLVYYRRRFHKRGQLSRRKVQVNSVCQSPFESASLTAGCFGFEDIEELDACCWGMDSERPFWTSDHAGLLSLTIPLSKVGEIKLELSFPVLPLLNNMFKMDCWLFQALLLIQCGTIMAVWPMVHLEMLFIDNFIGLRFLLFEGCLHQVVAFVFMVLSVFHRPNDQGNQVSLQLPVTSIKFKLSCIQNLNRHMVFAFYSFSKLETVNWLYLDAKLKIHCLFTKQLPLSECTFDNIKALQSGSAHLAITPAFEEPSSIEGSRKRSGQTSFHMGVSKESSYVNMSQMCTDERHGRVPTFALSFTAAPTFFRSLHLKLLLERSLGCISLQDHSPIALQEHHEKSTCSKECPAEELQQTSKNDAACSKLLSSTNPGFGIDLASAFRPGDWDKSSCKYKNSDSAFSGDSAHLLGPAEIGMDAQGQAQKWQCSHSSVSPSLSIDNASEGRPAATYSGLNGISVEIPLVNQIEKPSDSKMQSAQQPLDLCWSMNDGVIRSPNPTAPRSMWYRNRSSSVSSSFGYLSHAWPDGKADLIGNGFGNGPKKPRTQVSYMLPYGGQDVGSRHRSLQHKGLSHQRIRRANEKRTRNGSRSSQRDLEFLSCDTNVLITSGDRGWREQGAQVVLERIDHSEWKLAIKVSGTTRYSYKAHQFLQPGTTNRYTHDMMWKGGKDWILEFPDRSQWMLFKEMHEECYNRNIRAALVKNIPIPGVRVIEESDDNGIEVSFVRNSSKYYRQVETDVDMAMNSSRILYDMDSDDERWLLQNFNTCSLGVITEEMFEKAMDRFEKVAYAQQGDQFTFDDLGELVAGIGPVEVIERIREHWQQKRQRKGMPLIRHFQPPMWERYQQQIKQWELAMAKANTTLSNGFPAKVVPFEKPPMFAFCLKPRGLEIPNRGSKQRSQRKFHILGHSNGISGDHDAFHVLGRRSNGFHYGDDRIVSPIQNHELSDASLFQTPARAFSPRDASCSGYFSMSSSDGSERSFYPKSNRNKSRKMGTFTSPSDPRSFTPPSDLRPIVSFNHRTPGKNNGTHRLNGRLPEWQKQKQYYSGRSQRHIVEQLDGTELDEFRLRDASGAAQHALNMAKLKRENAQRLLYRADVAIHKAVVALMTAEAIKTTFSEDSNGDG